MKFLVKEPAFVNNTYLDARHGAIVAEFADDMDADHVSLAWDPLDKAAQAAQRRVLVLRAKRIEDAKKTHVEPELKPIANLPVARASAVTVETLREAQKAATGNTEVI